MRLPTLLYDSRFNDGTPVATDEASGYSVLNLRDLRTWTSWKGASSGTKTITVDCGSAKGADALGIIGHNLSSVGADIVVRCSSDNFASENFIVAALKANSDKALLYPFPMMAGGVVNGYPCDEVWPDGASAAPAGWTLLGAGGTVARDAVDYKDGSYGCKITAAAVTVQFYHRNWNYTYYRGKTVSFGFWVKCSSANSVSLAIGDGVASSYSAYHSGGGGWEFLSVSRTIDAAATYLQFTRVVAPGVTATFDAGKAKVAQSVTQYDISDYVQPGHIARRYWRIQLANCTAAPQIAVAMIGNRLEFPSPPMTPNATYAEKVEAESTRGKTGHILGATLRYKPRDVQARFAHLSRDFVFGAYKTFWDGHASDLKPFFWAGDLDTFPSDVLYLKMKDSASFAPPLSVLEFADEIVLDMEGMKE